MSEAIVPTIKRGLSVGNVLLIAGIAIGVMYAISEINKKRKAKGKAAILGLDI